MWLFTHVAAMKKKHTWALSVAFPFTVFLSLLFSCLLPYLPTPFQCLVGCKSPQESWGTQAEIPGWQGGALLTLTHTQSHVTVTTTGASSKCYRRESPNLKQDLKKQNKTKNQNKTNNCSILLFHVISWGLFSHWGSIFWNQKWDCITFMGLRSYCLNHPLRKKW